MTTMWGVHNDTLTRQLVEGGFVSIGWDELGDLRAISAGREALKTALADAFPDSKPRAIAGWAGILTRFRDEMQPGDIVVAPYKPDSTINIGIITGDYEYVPDAETHRNRRRIDWKRTGLSRTVFTQPALYELGAFLTVFRIRKHPGEFQAALDAADSIEEITRVVAAVASATPDEETADEPRASRIERHTRDFVLDNLILSVLEGAQKGQTLSGPLPCVLGRKESDIIVADSLVSKKHAALQVVNGKLVLEDLNSTNGTMVNGKRIIQQTVVLGDIIGMGNTAMKIVSISP